MIYEGKNKIRKSKKGPEKAIIRLITGDQLRLNYEDKFHPVLLARSSAKIGTPELVRGG